MTWSARLSFRLSSSCLLVVSLLGITIALQAVMTPIALARDLNVTAGTRSTNSKASFIVKSSPVLQAGNSIILSGPMRFDYQPGPARTIYYQFTLASAIAGTLHIQNGANDGSNRVSGAIIQLNGALVSTGRTLNLNTPTLDIPIGLLASNELSVRLTGEPGSYLTITILAKPVITALSPQSGRAGDSINIQGSYFDDSGPTQNIVRFARLGGGQATAQVSAATATQLTTVVPVDAAIGPVSVQTAGGTATSPANFDVQISGPVIVEFSPKQGPAGSVVTLTGVGLRVGNDSPLVTFAGSNDTRVPAGILSATTTEVIAIVPNDAVTGSIQLTNADGMATTNEQFTVIMTLSLGRTPFEVERAGTKTATIILSAIAPPGGLTISLSSDNTGIATVPPSIVINAGQILAEFTVTGIVEGNTTIHASATGLSPASLAVTVIPPSPASIVTSPANGEGDVAVTRETILRFSRALGPTADITPQKLFATFGGQTLPTRIHVAPDRKTATLFYLQTLPASARVRVHFNTDGILDELGVPLDGDRDGQPGGTAIVDFETLTLTTLPGTVVVGRVFASQQGDGGVNTPLAGVVISVDGLETTLRTTTDAMGNFRLDPAPVGEFFVHIDGRAATNGVPVGAYYPVVGKKWSSKAGQETTIPDTFLPLIVPDTLTPVSLTQATVITFPPSVIAQDPRLNGVQISVPADSLYSDSGARGGMVGIAPVAPDRIPSPLPPGLNFPLVITVQTDGATNFDRPVPVCFPNLPDPTTGLKRAPGARSALWSFNHDIGDWEIVGPMRVSQDGSLTCSEPGVGIRQPGWHGTQPGVQGIGGEIKSGPACIQDTDCLTSPYRRPKVGYIVPVPDGCGPPPPNLLNWIIPDEPPGFPPGLFTSACNQHDIGYATYAPNIQGHKTAVDAQFLANLQSACANAGNVAQCQVWALVYWTAVTAFGNSVGGYKDGQRAASECPIPCNMLSALSEVQQGEHFMLSALSEVRQGPHFYSIEDVYTGAVILRGKTPGTGKAHATVRLGENGLYRQRILSVNSLETGDRLFTTSGSGSTFEMPTTYLAMSSAPDSDSDGLADDGESVVGTNPSNPDTDGDGVSDGAEVQQGTNPLDGLAVQTGVIATADTPGTAVDIAARNDIAVVADSDRGISVLNVAAGLNPVIVAQVDTPGTAQAVSFESNLVAVADGPAGLAIIDISDPPAARIERQIYVGAAGAQEVEVVGTLAYVVSGDELVMVDLPTGAILDRHRYLGGHIDDISVSGDYVYALSVQQPAPHTIHKIRVDSVLADPITSLTISDHPTFGRMHIFAGGDRVYVGSSDDNFTNQSPGVAIIQDNGSNMTLIGPPSAITAFDVAVNGSGLALFTGADPGLTSTAQVGLLDVRDPTKTDRFLTSFDTPGVAQAVSIYNGFGYVADGVAGLQVLNYLAFDQGGIPPTISLTSNFQLSATAGLAEEGQVMRLTANVSDDVQVRNVEFFVNGVSMARDGNFPFEHRFITPLLGTGPSFTIRACAFDTGGNRTCTTEITVTLVEDATPPSVRVVTPPNGSLHQQNTLTNLSATFSETLDASTLSSATFQVFSAGPDSQTGTPDDVLVTGGIVSYNAQSATAVMSFSNPLSFASYRAVVRGTVSDLVGHPLGADFAWTFTVRGPKLWVSDLSGSWHTPSNWSDNELPQPGDFVVIDRPAANVTVTYNAGTLSISSLQSTEAIVISGGDISIQSTGSLAGGLTLSGGTLSGAGAISINTLSWNGGYVRGTGSINVTGATTISFGTIEGRTLSLGTETTFVDGATLAMGDGATVLNPLNGVSQALGGLHISLLLTGPFPTLINQGHLVKHGSAPATIDHGIDFRNDGNLDIRAGAFTISRGAHSGIFSTAPGTTLLFRGGSLSPTSQVNAAGAVEFLWDGTFAGSTVAGSFSSPNVRISGFVTFSGQLGPMGSLSITGAPTGATFNTAAPVNLTALTVEAGSLKGAASVTAGTFMWSGGQVEVPNLTVMGSMTLVSGLSKALVDTTLTLGSSTTWSDAVFGSGLVTIVNPSGGTWDLADGAWIRGVTLTNAGTLRKTGGGVTSIDAGLQNSGIVEVQAGTLELNNGGTSSGSFIGSDGTTLRLRGTHTLDAASQVNTAGAVEFKLAFAQVAGSFNANSVTLDEPDHQNFVYFTGVVGGLARMTLKRGSATFNTTNSVSVNELTMSAGYLDGSANVTTSTLSCNPHCGLGGSGDLTVTGATTISSADISGRTLRLGTTTTLAGGGIRADNDAAIVNPVGGILEIQADVSINAYVGQGFVSNAGTIRMAGPASTLTIGFFGVFAVNFTNTGTIGVRLGGIAAGEFDRILVNGSATLDGVLDVRTMNGFVPASGNSFNIFTYVTRTGQFATILGNGETYTPTYGPSALTLTKP